MVNSVENRGETVVVGSATVVDVDVEVVVETVVVAAIVVVGASVVVVDSALTPPLRTTGSLEVSRAPHAVAASTTSAMSVVVVSNARLLCTCRLTRMGAA